MNSIITTEFWNLYHFLRLEDTSSGRSQYKKDIRNHIILRNHKNRIVPGKFYLSANCILLICIIVWRNVTGNKLSDYRKNDRALCIQAVKLYKITKLMSITWNSCTYLSILFVITHMYLVEYPMHYLLIIISSMISRLICSIYLFSFNFFSIFLSSIY